MPVWLSKMVLGQHNWTDNLQCLVRDVATKKECNKLDVTAAQSV